MRREGAGVLEETEKIYRATTTTSRKYPKRLTEYIETLVKRGRTIEAKYFFLELCKVSPNHEKTIRLGYTIAIATFDNDWVYKYDKLLTDSAQNVTEVLWFRLRYYQSQNNIAACESTSRELLERRLTSDQLSTVIEVCIGRQNYTIAVPLAKYLSKNRIGLTPQFYKWFRQIVITRLANTLTRCK